MKKNPFSLHVDMDDFLPATEEEKAYTRANLDRLNKEISDCDDNLAELNGFRKAILSDRKKEIKADREARIENKRMLREVKGSKAGKASKKAKAKAKVAVATL